MSQPRGEFARRSGRDCNRNVIEAATTAADAAAAGGGGGAGGGAGGIIEKLVVGVAWFVALASMLSLFQAKPWLFLLRIDNRKANRILGFGIFQDTVDQVVDGIHLSQDLLGTICRRTTDRFVLKVIVVLECGGARISC